MKISILTYPDPYHISDESYWDEINRYPELCVSQTMVNGLNEVYKGFKDNCQLTTMYRFIQALYGDWESQELQVRQLIEVHNAIDKMHSEGKLTDNIYKSLQYNTKSIVKDIRMFKELGLKYSDFNASDINNDQKILLEIYNIIERNSDSTFAFHREVSEQDIDNALTEALQGKEKRIDPSKIDFHTIVIHGIHQFSPSICCALEDLKKYKNIVFLFNYQEQYKAVYSTWLNIYSLFGLHILTNSGNQFVPNVLYFSYSSNLLADNIGRLSNGECADFSSELKDINVLEFENVTEFANYVAGIYEKAKEKDELLGNQKSILSLMSEQFYSPSKKVNDILRAYFPEQFGERHFLDYPLGHFFVSAMNLWNDDEKQVVINDFSDISECLQSGILTEKNRGELLNTLNMVMSFIERERTLNDVISRLEVLKKYLGSHSGVKDRVGYFSVSNEEVSNLIQALKELNNIILFFFSDFGTSKDSFREFYRRVQKFLVSKMADWDDLDKEMKEVIQKLLEKLKQSNLPESGSYACLKQTMDYYLSQDDNALKSAHWIVRGFEQIDGDILRSANQDPDKTTYHFCCLSDSNICQKQDATLPWPLDTHFFEYAHDALDLKYQLFLKSKLEYWNFNRYALLYGLEFNRCKVKLSYIKNENEKDNDLYFVLQLLGLKVKPYFNPASSVGISPIKKDDLPVQPKTLQETDVIRATLCPYRFALESLVQEKTIYRDRFLIHHYLRYLISSNVIRRFSGDFYDEAKVKNAISNEYQNVSDMFRISDELEKAQLIAASFGDVKRKVNKNGEFVTLSPDAQRELDRQADFLYTNLKNVLNNTMSEENIREMIASESFDPKHGAYCKYCSSKDICLSYRDDE